MDLDIAQIAERRVPRYTSYPTAPHFQPQSDETCYKTWLSTIGTNAASLYLHVPYCQKVCWYCACNMKLAAQVEPVLTYGQHLEREIDLLAQCLSTPLQVNHIHWGGGTPTAMPMPALTSIMKRLGEKFEIHSNAEIAFELDPRTFEPEMATGLAALGTNRVSLGVQEFDDKVQRTVNRIQPYETVKQTVDSLRHAGIKNINFDLMYGLPHQAVQTLERTVDLTLELAPDRIALFGYAHVPWMAKRQRQIPEQALPNTQERFEQAEHAAQSLMAAGYIRIGLDHFAKPDDAMAQAAKAETLRRNFQGYTVDTCDTLIGLGATSISALPQGYVQNISETGAYQRAVAAGHLPVAKFCPLTAEDKLRRDIIESIMCFGKVDLPKIAKNHGKTLAHFAPELTQCQVFIQQGLLKEMDGNLTLTEKGRPAMRVIAAVFDSYLDQQQTQQRHAQAV
jgi:oxygen-independent coproporphyrinogen-3 oxidase